MRRTAAVALLGTAGALLLQSPAHAGKRPAADTTKPSVSISTPSTGSSVSSAVTVTGAAADNKALLKVDLQVDGGAWTAASGTSSWSASATGLAAGSHTLTARATDTSGNVATSAVSVTVAAASGSTTWSANGLTATRTDVTNADTTPMLVGRGRTAEKNGLAVTLYRDAMSWLPYAEFRTSSGTKHLALPGPVPTSNDWYNASYALDGNGGLWVFSGGGPVRMRHYLLTGSGLPTGISLESTTTYGDTDSRANDLLLLASGGLVASWHQQGQDGAPQSTTVLYRSPSGTWSSTGQLPMYTAVSKWASAQHPSTGAIWLLGNSDARHTVTALRLSEVPSGLRVDGLDESFITTTQYGDNAPEAENPDLQLTADPSTGTLVAAYQGLVVQQFGDPATNGVKGAHVIVARIAGSGALSFSTLPVWAERVSRLTLSVQPGAVWVGFHPVDPATLDCSTIQVSKLSGSTWQGPVTLGKTRDAGDPVGFSATSPLVLADMADGHLAHFALS